jgi:hypothetical protein
VADSRVVVRTGRRHQGSLHHSRSSPRRRRRVDRGAGEGSVRVVAGAPRLGQGAARRLLTAGITGRNTRHRAVRRQIAPRCKSGRRLRAKTTRHLATKQACKIDTLSQHGTEGCGWLVTVGRGGIGQNMYVSREAAKISMVLRHFQGANFLCEFSITAQL